MSTEWMVFLLNLFWGAIDPQFLLSSLYSRLHNKQGNKESNHSDHIGTAFLDAVGQGDRCLLWAFFTMYHDWSSWYEQSVFLS